jgi:hypothetical protein
MVRRMKKPTREPSRKSIRPLTRKQLDRVIGGITEIGFPALDANGTMQNDVNPQ